MAVMHLTCISDGTLLHAIRDLKGKWTALGDVRAEILREWPDSLDPGRFEDVACADVAGVLHVCANAEANNLIHAIRLLNGSWTAFGDVRLAAQAPSGAIFSVAAAGIGSQLRLLIAFRRGGSTWSTNHEVWETFRNPSGQWRRFENRGGSFDHISCAGVGAELHIAGITFDSQGIRIGALEHAVDVPGPNWTPFGDVRAEILREHPGSLDPGTFGSVACAAFADELHLCAIGGGRILHTIRKVDGTWFPFGPVIDVVVAQNPGTRLPNGATALSCAVIGEDLHLVFTDLNGEIWRTVRRRLAPPHKEWEPFRTLREEILRDQPTSAFPARFSCVAIADSF